MRFMHFRFKLFKSSEKTTGADKVSLFCFEEICFPQLTADPVNRHIYAVGQFFVAASLSESAPLAKAAPLAEAASLSETAYLAEGAFFRKHPDLGIIPARAD